MRRRFNSNLCPKQPPKDKSRIKWGKTIGSPFNMWFRAVLRSNNIQIKEFAKMIDEPYPTVIGWRYRSDPRIWGMCRIARGLESLGLGKYDDILQNIKDLKKKRKG
tara:strand:+ start:522 stop:839 length:318 start_codon:yes stop_codon:yes gene_type:complete